MGKKIWGIVGVLFLSLFFTQSVMAELVMANKKLKLELLKSTPDGVEFKIKSKVAITPSSQCENWFIIPRLHEDYKVLTAFLLTASATKKKIDIEFDDVSQECLVPVSSLVIYQ